jgi:hypothetical protein
MIPVALRRVIRILFFPVQGILRKTRSDPAAVAIDNRNADAQSSEVYTRYYRHEPAPLRIARASQLQTEMRNPATTKVIGRGEV